MNPEDRISDLWTLCQSHPCPVCGMTPKPGETATEKWLFTKIPNSVLVEFLDKDKNPARVKMTCSECANAFHGVYGGHVGGMHFTEGYLEGFFDYCGVFEQLLGDCFKR